MSISNWTWYVFFSLSVLSPLIQQSLPLIDTDSSSFISDCEGVVMLCWAPSTWTILELPNRIHVTSHQESHCSALPQFSGVYWVTIQPSVLCIAHGLHSIPSFHHSRKDSLGVYWMDGHWSHVVDASKSYQTLPCALFDQYSPSFPKVQHCAG